MFWTVIQCVIGVVLGVGIFLAMGWWAIFDLPYRK